MPATVNHATESLDLTPWTIEPPARPGWYVASIERNPEAYRYWDGALWSAWVRDDAPEPHFNQARATPSATQAGIEHRGLTAAGYAAMAYELERPPTHA